MRESGWGWEPEGGWKVKESMKVGRDEYDQSISYACMKIE
jgi:hypothetical protein